MNVKLCNYFMCLFSRFILHLIISRHLIRWRFESNSEWHVQEYWKMLIDDCLLRFAMVIWLTVCRKVSLHAVLNHEIF